jgi:Bor protein
MEKKSFQTSAILIIACVMLSSCWTYTSVIGKGPQGNQQVTKQNHYVIEGLVPVNVSDSKQMAGGAIDYSVTTVHTFLDLLLSFITAGIYAPTTTTVTK